MPSNIKKTYDSTSLNNIALMDLEKALQWCITCLYNIFILGHIGLSHVQLLYMTLTHKHTIAQTSLYKGRGMEFPKVNQKERGRKFL